MIAAFDYDQLRLLLFVGILLLLMILESVFPKKQRQQSRRQRWQANLGLVAIDSLVLKLLSAVGAYSAAMFAYQHDFGLLTLLPDAIWLQIVLAFLLLDLSIYLGHIAFHKVPLLWRIHRVHHTDRDLDVTTGIRFHPLEILVSMLFKCLFILLLGPLPLVIILFEIVLNASAMFNHANLRLQHKVDKYLRYFIVTPDMHRVHHSAIEQETNSNYGFFIPWWDRCFRTYRQQPSAGHQNMVIGLTEYQTHHPASLRWSLLLPWKK